MGGLFYAKSSFFMSQLPTRREAQHPCFSTSMSGGSIARALSNWANGLWVFGIVAPCLFVALDLPAGAQGFSLRGGNLTKPGNNSNGVARGQATTAATQAATQAQQTSILAQHTQASLQNSILALQAMQAAQAASRSSTPSSSNLSALPKVADGLAQGGLVPDSGLASPGVANPVTTWVNANTPVQTTSQGQTTVNIQQTAQQALLHWNSFNVGANTTLNFDQSLGGSNAGQWVAINKVAPNVAPTQILGSIKSQGQVYVLNQNGILFGSNSQINVGALVASSLPINDNLVSRGLLNNPDYQFQFSQIDIQAGTQGPTAAFQPQENSPAPTSGVIAQTDAAGNITVSTPQSQNGDVIVQKGARITSGDTPEHVGGKVALIGPNVTNAGTISTPDGQTILAAGLQVGLLAHNVNDATLRGLDVSVGQVSDPSYAANASGVAGTASNAGLIEAPRADVTMVGKNVNQNGVIDSSTSVSLNGRIDLLANYNAIPLVTGGSYPGGAFNGTSGFYPTASGAVNFGANSQTQILPELSSSETIVGTQLALGSIVNVEAQTIHFNSSADLLVPGASVPYPYAQGSTTPSIFAYDENIEPGAGTTNNSSIALKSGVNLNAGNWLLQSDNVSYLLTYAPGQGGQVYFEPGSSVDVSGSQNVSASVSENIVTAQLLGTELANSPLQRTGSLRGSTIQVDLREVGVSSNGTPWIGTPVGDVSGYVNLVPHTVGELTSAGGSVGINAGEAVVMQPGSSINVSGGYINYKGANVQTTRVIQRGQIIDISQADPNIVVDGIYNGATETSTKWNVSQTFQSRILGGSHYDPGYIQGSNGGSLSIVTPSAALDGNLYGNTVSGIQQKTSAAQLTKVYGTANFLSTVLAVLGEPSYSALTFSFQTPDGGNLNYLPSSPTPPLVVFTSNSTLPAVGPFGSTLPAERVAEVDLSPSLVNADGFGTLTVKNGDGNVLVPADVSLQTPLGGSITMTGANIDIEGALSAPSGQLSFTTYDFSPFITEILALPAPDPTRGQFTLGAGASLNAAGQVIDNRETAAAPGSQPSITSGGSVKISSYNVDLASGSTPHTAINVSGGLLVDSKGKISYGNGGSIDIEAGQDTAISAILGGGLSWDPNMAQLIGYSGATGGSLTVKAPSIQIGGDSLLNGDTVASGHTLWLNPTDANGNLLQSDFFSQGGFASINLKSIGQPLLDANGKPTGQYITGTLIAPNTIIAPEVKSLVAQADSVKLIVGIETLPVGQRAPINLSFKVSGASDPFLGTLLVRGDFVMDNGAVIETDPQTNSANGVSINAQTTTVLGSVIAPGGAISITGGNNSQKLLLNLSEATPTLYLGPQSLLSAAGTTLLTSNSTGLRTGSVLPGGSITLDGNIFAQAGAVLDVSGASGVLDTTKAAAGLSTVNRPSASNYASTTVDSNGGAITFIGEQGMVTAATLRGAGGGPSAQGGTVTVSSGIYFSGGNQTPLDANLVITQSKVPDYASGALPIIGGVIGNTVLDGYGYNPLDGNTILQTGYFDANSFNSGGFDSLNLKGTVKFTGPVTISANRSLAVGDGGVILADSTVNLNAPYVSLGQPFQSPLVTQNQSNIFSSGGGAYYFSPTHGAGNLNVSSSFIDLGNLSLQGIGNANLTAANGDIRGNGVVDIAGALTLTAGQIYPTTENTFTIAAYDYNGQSGNSSITIAGSGNRQLPYSAGGVLNLYASNIQQGGVLRAPLGAINLGSGVLGATPIDGITGSGLVGVTPTSPVPPTQNITLGGGSITSVSAVDPQTGKGLTIPYGVNVNGVEWDDPAGNNITLAGNTVLGSGTNAIPDKTITISGVNIVDKAGSSVDISGGGDLFSYNFVDGTGGTNDILASSGNYAILPGYQSPVAPYYSPNDYTNSNLAVGEKIYLNASNGLPAGFYTLLPARYALLPGAFMITPVTGTPSTTTIAAATGYTVVSGYTTNGFDAAQTQAPLRTLFKVSPSSVVSASAQYDISYASTYLSQSARAANISVPLLPLDAGHLIVATTNSLSVQGSVNSQASAGGLGGLVDIATTSNILVYGPNTDLSNVPSSTLTLQSSGLSGFGAGSLLVGGYRQRVGGAYDVTVTTNSLTVDNAGASAVENGQTLQGLSAPDVILVSNKGVTLEPGAVVEQAPVTTSQPATSLVLNGDGALLRVSSNTSDSITRNGTNPNDTQPFLTIDSSAKLTGANGGTAGNITLDSSYATHLDTSDVLKGDTVNLDSGQISLELTTPAVAPATQGLILSGQALNNLQSTAENLSLLSYSSIDIYGSGQIGGAAVSGKYPVASFNLHASEIRGFSDSGGGGTVAINAQTVSLDNSPGGASPGATTGANGNLAINAGTIRLGTNQFNIDQYSNVYLNASSGLALLGETKSTQSGGASVLGQGTLDVAGNLTLNTPLIYSAAFGTSQAAPNETITVTGGNLVINNFGTFSEPASEGLGANLALAAQGIVDNSVIELPSGKVTMHATAGDISIGGKINAAGVAQQDNTLTEYTSGGQIALTSDQGSVNLSSGSSLLVGTPTGGGNGGQVSISDPNGSFGFAGATISGAGGAGEKNGTFSLDVGSLSSLDAIESVLESGGFTLSQTFRSRLGDVAVNGVVAAQTFNLSSDTGSILVIGKIDASGLTGGSINLTASGNINLASGSELTVAGQNFNDAGQGGSVTLEAGADTNGVAGAGYINIGSGSTIDLGVAANNAGSAALGDLNGTLLIRAPQITGNTDLQVNAINGNILNASSITIAGNQIFLASDGSIDNQEGNVRTNGNTFAGNTAGILSRLYNSNANGAALSALTLVEPSAEIVNPTGNLELNKSWSLSTYRFGPNVTTVHGSGAPGLLTLRAEGNVIFDFGASLSDGFDTLNTSFARSSNVYWTAPLLPAGDLSWSYQITAGADFSAADRAAVLSTASLQNLGYSGSVLIGEGAPSLPSSADTRSTVIPTYFQTIRTGTGNITIGAGGDILLLNNLATVYTAGTQAPALSGFITPTFSSPTPQSPNYGAQYSLEGGNVVIAAQGNIAHETASGETDSSLELPTTWLYRQGAVDASGAFLKPNKRSSKLLQTSWWVDFSNFFEGIGALGGGNVTLTAGQSINNVDAVVTTNARMSGTVPNLANLNEMGGGDVVVQAGQNINGGAYYVERGQGTLTAGGQIYTNSTRATVTAGSDPSQTSSWLPTTLFLGQGSFNVSAGGDLQLGPVANVFLLPQAANNSTVNLSYFSTYASTDALNVSSVSGQVTLKDNASGGNGSLFNWYNNIYVSADGSSIATSSQPWLQSAEADISGFAIAAALMPPTLEATAFSSDVNVIGSLTLLPSTRGTVDLVAAGSLNGYNINSYLNSSTLGVVQLYNSSTINLSDADPSKIPAITSPLSSQSGSRPSVFTGFNSLFAESGATQNVVLQTKQALHANINGDVLHAGDTNPVDLFAQTGDISGFTLYSPKETQIVAGQDITDIGLYIQNTSASDISVVSAGRDIVAYDNTSALRLEASPAGAGQADSGDIQISGPGTLEVLAGRDLNLGIENDNLTFSDGTHVGITSVGNARNPSLPFAGADVFAAAGLGGASAGLDTSNLDLSAFTTQFLTPGTTQGSRYLTDLGVLMGLPSSDSDQQVYDAFHQLPAGNQANLALDIYYDVLRDAGRDHNDPSSPNAGTYNEGFAAIHALFPGTQSGGSWPSQGDITLTSREIKTASGGNIDLLAPGGQLTVGYIITGQAVDQGILTEAGGNISIFTDNSVNVGSSRIFTLSGGNVIIWSTLGDIAAGSSSKTVQSAPPTRVLVDPQSGDVETDLAGLATGGGIGVLETVVGAPPSDVDLIAPNGTVNAGDAGIRASGNINIAAVRVLNAGNIQAGGKTSGTPTASTPNIAGISAASSAGNAVANSSSAQARPPETAVAPPQALPPSIISVEVLGYGGDDSDN